MLYLCIKNIVKLTELVDCLYFKTEPRKVRFSSHIGRPPSLFLYQRRPLLDGGHTTTLKNRSMRTLIVNLLVQIFIKWIINHRLIVSRLIISIASQYEIEFQIAAILLLAIFLSLFICIGWVLTKIEHYNIYSLG